MASFALLGAIVLMNQNEKIDTQNERIKTQNDLVTKQNKRLDQQTNPLSQKVGYTIPNKALNGKEIRPDNSVGMLFSKHLETYHPEYANLYKTYLEFWGTGGTEIDIFFCVFRSSESKPTFQRTQTYHFAGVSSFQY